MVAERNMIKFEQLPIELQETYIRWKDRENVLSVMEIITDRIPNKYWVVVKSYNTKATDKWEYRGGVWHYEVVT